MTINKFRTKAELLRDSEKHSRAWLEHSPVCTKIVDLDFNLQYMSDAGVKSLHIEDITEYYGEPYPLEFYPQSFKDQMIENLKLVKEKERVITQEASVVDTHGNEVWFHSTIVPINNDNDELDYFMVVSIDISERKYAEKNLLQVNNELEDRVKSRTIKLEEANRKLKVISETDQLTNIANRVVYSRRLRENIDTAKRNAQCLSMLMIDVDYFKDYNDKYGHDVGDIALRQIAEEISASLPRKVDLVARFGGEEFVVLLPETDIEGAFKVAESIRSNILLLGIQHGQSDIANIMTISVGVASLRGNDLNDANLLKQADKALYKAKNEGRNCIKTS